MSQKAIDACKAVIKAVPVMNTWHLGREYAYLCPFCDGHGATPGEVFHLSHCPCFQVEAALAAELEEREP